MVEEITIRVSGRIIERIIWIIIVILLIVALIWTNISDIKESGKDYARQLNKEAGIQAKTDDKIDIKEETRKDAEKTTETGKETKTDDTGSRETPDPRVKDGVVEIMMTARPITEPRGTPTNRFLRATVISYEILNGLKDFMPRINISIFDEDDNKEDYKEVIIYDDKISEKGKVFAQNERISLSFNEINKTKTVEFILMDEQDNILDTYTEQINFND